MTKFEALAMTILTALISVLIVACTEEPAPPKNNSYYKQELDIAQAELQNCKDELYNLRMGSNVNSTSTTTQSEPVEDEYEEIEVYKLSTTTCRSGKGDSCGLTFSQCDDDKIYQCMTNVVYKIETQKVKVEQ